MKRIEYIAPVDAMRGNLSGAQLLEYAQNNNPAYEAPDGKQYARNYATRYIGAKRSSTALKYFSVRTKSATTLTAKSRMAMALLACTSALRASEDVNIKLIQAAYEYQKGRAGSNPPDYLRSFNKYWAYNCRNMLQYNQAYMRFVDGVTVITIYNPFNCDNENAPSIDVNTWVKFAPLLAFTMQDTSVNVRGGYHWNVDGRVFFAMNATNEGGYTSFDMLPLQDGNPNFVAACEGLATNAGNMTYNGRPMYTPEGVVVTDSEDILPVKYTTARPSA